MADTHFGLVGTGGFGREVMPLARASLPAGTQVYYVESAPTVASVNGIPVLSMEAFSALKGEKLFNIAVANSRTRQNIAAQLAPHAEAIDLRAASATLLDADTIRIGEGMILCSYSMATTNVTIGKFFQANLYSYIGHDCVIGDYVTFAPGVKCNGNVHIHDHAYIGTGAIIRQGQADRPLVIGEGAIIGMGAVVTKDIAPGTTVIGNPAKPMVRA